MKVAFNTVLLLALLLNGFSSRCDLRAQESKSRKQPADRISVQAGSTVWIADSSFMVVKDTILLLPHNKSYRIEKGPYGKSDSFYKSIRARVDKNIITRTLSDLVLIPDRNRRRNGADTVDFQASVEYFKPYSGKNLARIRFKQVDILAGSVRDTALVSGSLVSNTLNALHVKTRNRAVADNLLFQEGDTLRPDDLADTERLLRALPSIEDARIYVLPAARDTGNVDLLVVTQDRFSWGIGMTLLSADKYRWRLINRNLLGWGAELKYTVLYDQKSDPRLAHDFKCDVYNIRGTFISSQFNYIYSQKSQSLWLSFNRPFISPHIAYLGSLDLGSARNLVTFNSAGVSSSEFVKVFSQDLWLGRIFSIGRPEKRNTLIFSARLSRTRFSERPAIEGVNTYLYDNTLVLGRLSLARIKYFKSRMVYSYGRTEDIPYGLLVQATSGYEAGEVRDRYYYGSDFSWANTVGHLGYLGLSAEFGIFRRPDIYEQGVINLRSLYFSPLLEFHNFHIRQIIRTAYTNGINRPPLEIINLKHKLAGFSRSEPVGRGNVVMNLETVAFTPWYFYGFKFALYTYADFALLSAQALFTSRTEFYSTAGLGCRLKNESLVFNTLNLRIGYFFRTPSGLEPWSLEISNAESDISQGLLGLKPAVPQYK